MSDQAPPPSLQPSREYLHACFGHTVPPALYTEIMDTVRHERRWNTLTYTELKCICTFLRMDGVGRLRSVCTAFRRRAPLDYVVYTVCEEPLHLLRFKAARVFICTIRAGLKDVSEKMMERMRTLHTCCMSLVWEPAEAPVVGLPWFSAAASPAATIAPHKSAATAVPRKSAATAVAHKNSTVILPHTSAAATAHQENASPRENLRILLTTKPWLAGVTELNWLGASTPPALPRLRSLYAGGWHMGRSPDLRAEDFGSLQHLVVDVFLANVPLNSLTHLTCGSLKPDYAPFTPLVNVTDLKVNDRCYVHADCFPALVNLTLRDTDHIRMSGTFTCLRYIELQHRSRWGTRGGLPYLLFELPARATVPRLERVRMDELRPSLRGWQPYRVEELAYWNGECLDAYFMVHAETVSTSVAARTASVAAQTQEALGALRIHNDGDDRTGPLHTLMTQHAYPHSTLVCTRDTPTAQPFVLTRAFIQTAPWLTPKLRAALDLVLRPQVCWIEMPEVQWQIVCGFLSLAELTRFQYTCHALQCMARYRNCLTSTLVCRSSELHGTLLRICERLQTVHVLPAMVQALSRTRETLGQVLNPRTLSSVRTLDLTAVELNSGPLGDLAALLPRLPNLVDLKVHSSGYLAGFTSILPFVTVLEWSGKNTPPLYARMHTLRARNNLISGELPASLTDLECGELEENTVGPGVRTLMVKDLPSRCTFERLTSLHYVGIHLSSTVDAACFPRLEEITLRFGDPVLTGVFACLRQVVIRNRTAANSFYQYEKTQFPCWSGFAVNTGYPGRCGGGRCSITAASSSNSTCVEKKN